MKLYLSSYRIPNLPALEKLVGKAAAETKLGYITNAKDYYAPRARAFKVQAYTDYFAGLGFDAEEIDLREFDAEGGALLKRLRKYTLSGRQVVTVFV